MNPLILRERELVTVFDLLGERENDITFAIGFALARSPRFLERLLGAIGAPSDFSELITIDLQRGDRRDRGFTDIELRSPAVHAIVEAKRGWHLPASLQLERYRQRLETSDARDRRYVVLTQWGLEPYVRHVLGSHLSGWPIATLGLGQVAALAAEAANRERRPVARNTLSELAIYLKGVASMRDLRDNSVYVVSLSARETSDLPGYTTIRIAEQLGLYWYPAGKAGWPKQPPNYIGFRYGGRLRSIHHVREYKVSLNLAADVPGAQQTSSPRFLIKLGPPIQPARVVPNGPRVVRDTRIWADIDLLLTAETISGAMEQTKHRHAATPQ